MMEAIGAALDERDLLVYVVDASRPPGEPNGKASS